MKFSYSLIKGFVPKLKSKGELINALTMHSFEAENGSGDTLEVAVPPNRYSDAASHWGLAKEAAAIFDFATKELKTEALGKSPSRQSDLKVKVEDKASCPRYTAAIFENIHVQSSPQWLQKALKDCGLRPINNVVDIMNYVMLEVGQPLHAFDADKLFNGTIVVRRAKEGEKIISIDGVEYQLTKEMLVIADPRKPLAVAGIKGGTGSEVIKDTKRIIVESANFDSVAVYKTSRALNLVTDASVRFAHDLTPALAGFGLERVAYVLAEVAGTKLTSWFDSQDKPAGRRFLKFDIQKFNSLIGLDFTSEKAATYLQRLGFRKAQKNEWEIPALRSDIETHEDLAEEIVRLYGLDGLKPQAPHVALQPSESREILTLKDRIRNFLITVGLDEVYNNSFVAEKDLALGNFWGGRAQALLNPISAEFDFLRPNLAINLLKNINDNFRFFKEVRVFEIGHIFEVITKNNVKERVVLGLALGQKNKETFFELKGIVDEFLKSLGLTEFSFVDWPKPVSRLKAGLRIESEDKIIGYLAHAEKGVSAAEIDLAVLLDLVEGELSFRALPKYPAIERDISLLVDANARIGDIVLDIEEINPRLIQDVDLVDEYRDSKWERLQSITLRIVFQAEDRTLTSEEVDKEIRRMTGFLQSKYKAQVR